MQISYFCKKISSETDNFWKKKFKILFLNLKHDLFCEVLWKKFHLQKRYLFSNVNRKFNKWR